MDIHLYPCNLLFLEDLYTIPAFRSIHPQTPSPPRARRPPDIVVNHSRTHDRPATEGNDPPGGLGGKHGHGPLYTGGEFRRLAKAYRLNRDRGGTSRFPPSHTTGHTGHVSSGSVE